MERYKIKKTIIIFILLFMGCAYGQPKGQPESNEVILKFKSDIPVKVTIYKSCEGNWNFCDVDNWNFKKWE